MYVFWLLCVFVCVFYIRQSMMFGSVCNNECFSLQVYVWGGGILKVKCGIESDA